MLDSCSIPHVRDIAGALLASSALTCKTTGFRLVDAGNILYKPRCSIKE
jgi:hypothetical protein